MTDDDSTTSVGLFNTAEAYRLSAIALERAALGSAPAKIGFAEKPVRFLYCHAIELYLKALLRQKHSAETIRNKFGHNTKRLVEEAETLGMFVTVGDRDVFAIMHDTDIVIEARYIRTGPKTSIRFDEEVRRTCKRVRDSVGDLKRACRFGDDEIKARQPVLVGVAGGVASRSGVICTKSSRRTQ